MLDEEERVKYAEPKDSDNPFSLANDSPALPNERRRGKEESETPPRKSKTRSPTRNSRSTNKKVAINHHDNAE